MSWIMPAIHALINADMNASSEGASPAMSASHFPWVNPKKVRSILEIKKILKDACLDWDFEKVPGAVHNAPLTHPEWIIPKIRDFLNHSSNGGE